MKNVWLDKNIKKRNKPGRRRHIFYIDVDVDVDEVDDFIKRLKYKFKTRAVK